MATYTITINMCKDNHKEPFYKKAEEDEKNLWLKETSDIKKLQTSNIITAQTKSNTAKLSTNSTSNTRTQKSTQKALVVEHEKRNSIKSNKKKRKTIPIDITIDLHSLNENQAYTALIETLDYAYNNNKIFILIITGKGKITKKNNQDLPSGVLYEKVPKWLESSPMSSRVFKIQQADKEHGGAGALYVQLRKKSNNS